VLGLLFVFFTPLAFFPVPWPDDSAFYFVARELFRWPPRWVMLPQAPFEPSYAEWNFNTMPLYPILIGLGKSLGLTGSRLLKLWPLGFWAASGVLLLRVLRAQGLSMLPAFTLGLLWALEPNLRWASVLVRPESLIGLCGMALVLGLSFGFPERFRARKFWDPVAALLAISAYAHFNAIHLLFPVVIAGLLGGASLRESLLVLVRTGALTALYLLPWGLTVLWRLDLFIRQMGTQWERLAVPNGWLTSFRQAVRDLFPDMGNPGPWPEITFWMGGPLWGLILAAVGVCVAGVVYRAVKEDQRPKVIGRLLPASAWVLGAAWLWHSKPEVWFTYYLHAAAWTLAGVLMIEGFEFLRESRASVQARMKELVKQSQPVSEGTFEEDAVFRRAAARQTWATASVVLLALGVGGSAVLSSLVAFEQAFEPPQKLSWNWNTYRSFVDCVDQDLMALEKRLGNPSNFHVWGPTFPDILIELSERHPNWQFTRTNDFHARRALAVDHGVRNVHALVTTETIQPEESWLTGEMREFPLIHSAWMDWKGYYLNDFMQIPAWMPHRRYCQRGRWRAFLFLKS
jgi:hypothetical protein